MTRALRRAAYAGACLGLIVATPRLAAGQSAPEPQLIFSIFGGVAGHGELWHIPKQQLLTLLAQPGLYDTLNLRRRLTTGPILGLTGTLYRGAHFGLTGEIAYIGLRKDTDCEIEQPIPDVQQRNEQLCDNIAAAVTSASNVAISVGAAYRLGSRSPVSPYVRAQGGLSVRGSSLIQVTGRFTQTLADGSVVLRERVVIRDETDVRVYPLVAVAAGVTFALSPGYHIRAEIRDHLLILQRPAGPASDLAVAEIENFVGHAPTLVFGIDIVLEKSRGRRY